MATNVVASQPPKRRPTGTLTTSANKLGKEGRFFYSQYLLGPKIFGCLDKKGLQLLHGLGVLK